MNKKNKILLTSVGLAMLSGIAATGSTFAWFTTTRTASVSYSSATIESRTNALNVAYKESLNTIVVNSENANEVVLTGANKITDISGNGLAFYKPVWTAAGSADASEASSIETLNMAGEGVADGYFIDFTLTISRSTTGTTGMKVYLGSGTKITGDGSTESAEAVKASRLAIVNDTTLVDVLAMEEDSSYNFIQTGDGPLYSVPGFETGTLTPIVGTLTDYNNATTADAAVDENKAVLVANLTTATSVDITFRAWLEGEDEEATNAAIGGVFDINIDLYGLNDA